VSCYGSHVVVGAPGESSEGISSGAVYMFTANGHTAWKQREKYTPALRANESSIHSAYFGCSVALRDEWIAIGARGADGVEIASGAVFMTKLEADGNGNKDDDASDFSITSRR
jgi:hypothetical protein